MQNKTNKQKQTISLSNLPNIIIAVVLIVGIGAVYGLMGYLFFGIKENVTPVIQESTQKPSMEIADNYFGNEFIQVKSPQKNAVIKNPVLISGKANVFEANVRVRISDDNKNILADDFITAGGWMDKLYSFQKEIDYKTPQTKNGLIEIFEESVKDGSDLYKVEVAVVFEDYEDEISDWKVYRNEEYGFEVKYPKNWYFSRDKQAERKPDYNLHIGFAENSKILSQNVPYSIEFMIWSSKIGIWDGDPCHYEILKERNNKKYVLKTCSLNKYENIFDKMAESFKFIEKDETADWKVYQNEEFGFEVKYPEDWEVKKNDYYLKNVLNNDDAFDISIVNQKHGQSKESQGLHISDVDISFGEIFYTESLSKIFTKEFIQELEGNKYVRITFKENNKQMYATCALFRDQDIINKCNQILSTFKFIEKDGTADWQTYRNEEFGFEFQYPKNEEVKQINNKFYVGGLKGQSVEIFKKTKGESLNEAIEKEFLKNYSKDDCFVQSLTTEKNNYPNSYFRSAIFYQGENKWLTDPDKCPSKYTRSNWVNYFLADENNFNRYAFFSIGQYAIVLNENDPSEEWIAWQQTFKFIEEEKQ